MTETNLIVRAESLGITHASNQAVLEAFETGVLTCASLVVAAPWTAEAVTLCHAHPEWEIGLRIVLTCDAVGARWGPVSGGDKVPGLVDATGAFFSDLPAEATEEEIAREMAAQVARAVAWGMTPAYLECDQASVEAVKAVLHRLSESRGIPANVISWGLVPLSPSRGTHISMEASVLDCLASLSPGTHLWSTHPAQCSPETWALWQDEAAAQRHQEDLVALCSPIVRKAIEQRGIELISFRQHIETKLGTHADRE